MKKKKKIETPNDKLKYEIAKELGLMEKIEKLGWGGLTAKESGRIGGIMTLRNREKLKNRDNHSNSKDEKA
ncbi:Small, acid-soluble spore protein, alpha/beta type [Proteiniborus ethanoligenes]|uniref:Small, acid-soluble spore protein, alpha/beta type n=1 Tax=Proteiniborus ethanoligenes TaxID=415015 RepID=A0A1H3SRA7_9FIRM|nr:small, acid-soluble spore protein, alpha/beta type [Proteiniborus ethanoligenes]TAH63494.1 MAG: small, acid-soluble spore protein, alpha/beta type [Gottschalkiaceae bacterium]SDZ40237.1 Small, acid-soluble spore protein, alpha/beta type [Proteiniborus ethanoligenes]